MTKKPRKLIRDFHGYRQHLEQRYTASGRIINRWVFDVYSFSWCDQYANVTKSDGSREYCPTDDRDRVLIHGKRYSRRFWNH